MSLLTHNFSNVDLVCFRQYQRRSFETLIEVGRTLKAGETEIQVAHRIRKAFHQYAGEASSAGYDQTSYMSEKSRYLHPWTPATFGPSMDVIATSKADPSYNNISPERGPI